MGNPSSSWRGNPSIQTCLKKYHNVIVVAILEHMSQGLCNLCNYRSRVCVCVCKIGPISARTLSFRHQMSRKFFSHSNFPIPYLRMPRCFENGNGDVCVYATFDQFLPVRSQFDSNQHVNSVRIATFQSANFGPLLFAFNFQKMLTLTANRVNLGHINFLGVLRGAEPKSSVCPTPKCPQMPQN